MSSLRVMVVDDEQLAREELCFQLEQLGDVEVIAQSGNGLEALAAVERENAKRKAKNLPQLGCFH